MAGRYQTTYCSTPASLIYAQSWPVPSSNSAFGKRYADNLIQSNSQRRGTINSWTEENKRKTTPTFRHTSGSTDKPRSWAKAMLHSHYPEWVEEDAHMKLDMAKEFKLTLKMFKSLTQQVQDVGEELKSNKKSYSFKRYFSNRNSPSGHYQSPVGVNTRTPTQLFNVCREKIDKPRPQSHLEMTRKSLKYPNENIGSRTEDLRCVTSHDNQTKLKMFQVQPKTTVNECQTAKQNKLANEISDNSDYLDCAQKEEEKESGLGYIDPVPSNWSELKLEEIEERYLLESTNKPDPFILRYFQLRKLQAETVESEKYSTKSEENIDNISGVNIGMKNTSNCSKSQTKKSNENGKSAAKIKVEKVVRAPEIIKKTNSFKSEMVLTKLPSKCTDMKKFEKISETGGNKLNCGSKKTKCLSARVRKENCSSKIYSKNSNESYDASHYDIVEIARTFHPPCKDRINSKQRPVTAKSAISKGLLPGKSCHSQRRFSLTNKTDKEKQSSKTKTSRQKSAKRGSRRCVSSKE